jgi:PKD repeat protein
MKHITIVSIFLLSFIYSISGYSQYNNDKIRSSHAVRVKEIPKKSTKIKSPAEPEKLQSDLLSTKSRAAWTGPTTMGGWSALNVYDLVDKLEEATDYKAALKCLYDYDAGAAYYLYSNDKIQAVERAIYNKSVSYNGTLSSGLYGLNVYMHTAIYHEFYKNDFELNSESKRWHKIAFGYFKNNSHLFDNTEESLTILDEFLINCDYPGTRADAGVIKIMKSALKEVAVDKSWKSISDDRLLRKYATAYNRVFFYIFRASQPADAEWVNAIKNDSEFFSTLGSYACDAEIRASEELSFMASNAASELCRMASVPDLLPKVEPLLVNIINTYSDDSPEYLKAVEALKKHGNCATYGLCHLDPVAIKQAIIDKLFPNTWIFDDGKMVVKTPLSYKQTEGLYYAATQVRAQVFRLLQRDTPVPGDPNETLTMVVYGTKDDYIKYQYLLNGLPTNNGGIYIEKGATFYTYERTPQQSIYSLEELFRHEYVHYLQGRYMENGFWGATEFFQNNRLTWWEEGMAEMFAGSTDSDGVKIRDSFAWNIKRDGESAYMTPSEIFSASYDSGFTFYRYACMVWAYLMENDIETLRELSNYIYTDNISAFDNRLNQLKSDASFNQAYKNYLNQVANNAGTYWTASTDWEDDNLLSIGNTAHIQNEFNEMFPDKTATVSQFSTNMLKRFAIDGTVNGPAFGDSLDVIIREMKESKFVNNFKYLAGYYHNVNGNSADFRILGSLRDSDVPDNPIADFVSEQTTIITGGSVKFSNKSTGYIKDIQWNFSGGNISQSEELTPVVTYAEPGVYPVTLTVTGVGNVTNTKTVNNFVTVIEGSNLTYCAATTGGDNEFINVVSLGGATNNSDDFPANGYADFTNIILPVTYGTDEALTVETNKGWGPNHVIAWIDWNRDGFFADNETVLKKTGDSGVYTSTVTVPDKSQAGVTRMRVRYSYSSYADPCGYRNGLGEVEDYTILIKDNPDLVEDVPPTVPQQLHANGVGTTVINVKWNPSTDNSVLMGYELYVNGELNRTTEYAGAVINNLTPDTQYTIKVRAKDRYNNLSDFSDILTVSTVADDVNYCTPNISTNRDDIYIKKLQVGDYTHYGTFGKYTDFTNSEFIFAERGSNIDVNITPNIGWGPIQSVIWIDWNRDGDFTDAGEKVYNRRHSDGTSPVTITVPESATLGLTRLRARMAYYNTTVGPCDPETYLGEVKDYSFIINASSQSAESRERVPQLPDIPVISGLTVYPNPADDYINICGAEGRYAKIYNVNGELVYSSYISSDCKRVNIFYLPNGIYVVKVNYNNHTEAVKLMVK